MVNSNVRHAQAIPEMDFPKLMYLKRDKNIIALFRSKITATILVGGEIGNQTSFFEYKNWEDFEGEITLSNKR